MDVKLLLNLVFGVFSFKRKNMRFPNVRRVLVTVVLFPLFIGILLVNKVFILLDYVVVPFFLTQKVNKPVFVVAPPRSGTTYIYYSLAAQNQHFTCFKLWEIIFAPSVLQKLILLGVIRVDGLLGSPLKWSVLKLEKILIGDLQSIHPISISMPEEDEAVLLWDLSSIYLNFFYPDSHFFDDYLLFDEKLSERKRFRIMRSYKRYVLRHNFVFNRKGEKLFLSKNPLMMCKLNSLKAVFPDAIVLTINRGPHVIIPSTISLNNALYGLFTSAPSHDELNDRTKRILINWLKMAHQSLNSHYIGQFLEIDFKQLIGRSPELQQAISSIVGRDLGTFLLPREVDKVNHKSTNKYKALSDEELEEVLREVPFLAKYCD